MTHDGQQYNEALDYAPLPVAVIKKLERQIARINVDGKMALPEDLARLLEVFP